jgi:serine/threonine protein phosphatase PrpC
MATRDYPPNTRKPRDDEIDTFGLTHQGKVRKENQDHYLLASIYKRLQIIATSLPSKAAQFATGEDRVAYVAMVADGVGGGVGGQEAASTAVESAMQYVHDSMDCYLGKSDDEAAFADALQRTAIRSHEAILARRAAMAETRAMATTLTLFLGVWPRYYLLQVGDSRYYRWRDGTLTQVTRDQTFAEALVDSGALTREAAGQSRLAHILSSALGAEETLPVVTALEADWRNIHLLCSDGLTKHVSDKRIGEILGSMTSAKQACEQLLQDALDGGGTDNITLIVGRTIPKNPSM